MAILGIKKDMGSHKKYQLGKKTYSPEELSSFVIRTLDKVYILA